MENEESVCSVCGQEMCGCNESDLYEATWAGLQDNPEHFSCEEEDC